ncbi:lymphocyte antigen 6 complex locus protein G6d-like [Poecilia formosa]|uniref:Lymphocyte antigen-6, epidermis n=1 Tax=Poecilia formosa TaxID=48698 RepID=A0A096ME40_POEFO|nr:PREDICTED: lymphocyte antigen 6 complex locus protein G6d-like [Poecilia formosa]
MYGSRGAPRSPTAFCKVTLTHIHLYRTHRTVKSARIAVTSRSRRWRDIKASMSEKLCSSHNGLSFHRHAAPFLSPPPPSFYLFVFLDFSSKMNRIVFVFVAGLAFAVGQNLECYKCSIGLWNLCLTSKTTCGTGEHCFSGEGGSGDVKLKMKGCLEVAKCNKTDDVKLPGTSNTTIYKMTKTCCSTNLCNVAPGLPGASALSLAAVAMFSLLAANFMV